MNLRSECHGNTCWTLKSQGNRYYLHIKHGRKAAQWYVLERDDRHARFHPLERELEFLTTLDLRVLNNLARSYLGDAPSARPNPTGVRGRTPLLLKRRVAVILQSNMRNRGGAPDGEDIQRAFAIATKVLQQQGFIRKGSHELTRKGLAKQAEITPEKKREADEIFAAMESGNKIPGKQRRAGSRRSEREEREVEAPTPKRKSTRKTEQAPRRSVRDMIRAFWR